MVTKKKTEEPEWAAAVEENGEAAQTVGAPETSEMDLNDLLASMDADPESSGSPDSDEAANEVSNDGELSNGAHLRYWLDGGDNRVSANEVLSINAYADEDNQSENGDNLESMDGNTPIDDTDALPEPLTEKPKRATRKKKTAEAGTEAGVRDEGASIGENRETPEQPSHGAPMSLQAQARKPVSRRPATPSVLTIESRAEVESQENIEETAWHEIRNAYRTRRILSGVLSGVEKTEAGKTIAVVSYNDYRVAIPLKEMMINLGQNQPGQSYNELILRQNKILSNMLGAEIDFIIKGIESKERSIVASRKDAMMKKRQLFYFNTDAAGMYRIYEGRIVQARVIAVAEKVVRIEAFGAECAIMARDLSWDWIGDASERYNVGDKILVRILSVKRNSLEDVSIIANVKSVTDDTSYENLKKCRVQSKYAGKVTDVYKGVVFIRLANGANAIAHACYDRRMPGKKDDVSFAVTRIDEERGVATGIITRIIKQNL